MSPDSRKFIHELITGKLFPSPTDDRVYDYSFSPVNLMGKLYDPFVDKLWLKNGGKRPVWPGDAPFAVCLTHDVDVISVYDWKSNLRRIKHVLATRTQQNFKQNLILIFEAMENAIRGTLIHENDPFHQFEKWLEVEKEVSAHSTFFFTPENTINTHFSDCWYKYSDNLQFETQKITVGELMQAIDRRGWEIGLHPSWNASTDGDIMKAQKKQVEEVVGHSITSVRQHWLNFDNFKTPAVQVAAGFKYDSSIGFNDNIGFRRGTSYPHHLVDLETNQIFPMFEIPLIVQDGAMFHHRKGLRLNHDMGLKYIQNLANQVRETSGVFTLLWHPNTINQPHYWKAYKSSLKLLHDMGAWFGSVKEIGEWWHRENDIDLTEYFKQ